MNAFIIECLYHFQCVWNCMELYGILWNCLELYEKKFPIYENCMISIFGQPGHRMINADLGFVKNMEINLERE